MHAGLGWLVRWWKLVNFLSLGTLCEDLARVSFAGTGAAGGRFTLYKHLTNDRIGNVVSIDRKTVFVQCNDRLEKVVQSPQCLRGTLTLERAGKVPRSSSRLPPVQRVDTAPPTRRYSCPALVSRVGSVQARNHYWSQKRLAGRLRQWRQVSWAQYWRHRWALFRKSTTRNWIYIEFTQRHTQPRLNQNQASTKSKYILCYG